jgi:hypothetical protein
VPQHCPPRQLRSCSPSPYATIPPAAPALGERPKYATESHSVDSYEWALEITHEVLEEPHPDTTRSLNNLGWN